MSEETCKTAGEANCGLGLGLSNGVKWFWEEEEEPVMTSFEGVVCNTCLAVVPVIIFCLRSSSGGP